MYEDAQDSGDEQPQEATRKTAGGRVIIKSKEGDKYKEHHEL